MTRRVIAYRSGSHFYVSQEFNGDRAEMRQFNPKGCRIKTDWVDIPPMFDGVTTLEQFKDTVRRVETLYGYKAVPVEAEHDLPVTEEVWMLSCGALLVETRYGSSMVECLAEVAKEYGFKTVRDGDYSITFRAKSTDGHWVSWFTIIPSLKGARHIKGNNTDQANIWLGETRPDMTPERCIAFFEEINHTLGLFGEDRVEPSEWIDPEDWQIIANVHDAYTDARYTGKRECSVTRAINIQWDTDGQDVALPTELDIPDGIVDEDEISDYISAVTGFCHTGFQIERSGMHK